jgi:hypothetical protein
LGVSFARKIYRNEDRFGRVALFHPTAPVSPVATVAAPVHRHATLPGRSVGRTVVVSDRLHAVEEEPRADEQQRGGEQL